MDILEKYKDILINELIKIYPNEDLSAISFEFPRDITHGDFSTNAALILSKKLKINPNEVYANIEKFFELKEYEKKVTLSDYLGKNFVKETAYTIRCGGGGSPIDDRHNWDGYWIDGEEYRLTIEDGLKLQGFENYNLIGKKGDKWKLLGNTIPTIFTDIIGKQLMRHCPSLSLY